jgi:hypothetical protein
MAFTDLQLVDADDLNNFSVTTVTTSGAITPGAGIAFPATQAASANANTLDDYEENTYTPTWSSGGVAPALGNGTIAGTYIKVGKKVQLFITLTMGGTTTYGSSNAWTFTLPFTADTAPTTAAGTGYGLDAGTQYYHVIPIIAASASTLTLIIPGSGNSVAQTTPFSWGNTDSLQIAITYIANA